MPRIDRLRRQLHHSLMERDTFREACLRGSPSAETKRADRFSLRARARLPDRRIVVPCADRLWHGLLRAAEPSTITRNGRCRAGRTHLNSPKRIPHCLLQIAHPRGACGTGHACRWRSQYSIDAYNARARHQQTPFYTVTTQHEAIDYSTPDLVNWEFKADAANEYRR